MHVAARSACRGSRSRAPRRPRGRGRRATPRPCRRRRAPPPARCRARRPCAPSAGARRATASREVDLLARPLALAGPAEHQQVVDRVRHAVELVDARRRGAAARPSRSAVAPASSSRSRRPGQRRAQLMRRVGDELGLGPQRARQPLGHEVERARERALLPAALHRRARVEVARGDPVGRRAEPLDRPGDPACEQERGEQRGEQHREHRRPRCRRRAAHGVVDRVDALRQPHGADDAPAGEHRRGGGEDLRVERLRPALVLEAPAVERRPRARGGWRSRRRSPPESTVSASTRAAAVDDDDTGARRRCRHCAATSPSRSASRVWTSRPTPAASTSACVRASARTSLPTRSRRFSPSGTAKATMTRATR